MAYWKTRSACKRCWKTKTGVEKSKAGLLLGLQVGSPVTAATSLVAAKGASRLVAVTPSGYTASSPPEQRPSSPMTGKIDKTKHEINICGAKHGSTQKKNMHSDLKMVR